MKTPELMVPSLPSTMSHNHWQIAKRLLVSMAISFVATSLISLSLFQFEILGAVLLVWLWIAPIAVVYFCLESYSPQKWKLKHAIVLTYWLAWLAFFVYLYFFPVEGSDSGVAVEMAFACCLFSLIAGFSVYSSILLVSCFYPLEQFPHTQSVIPEG